MTENKRPSLRLVDEAYVFRQEMETIQADAARDADPKLRLELDIPAHWAALAAWLAEKHQRRNALSDKPISLTTEFADGSAAKDYLCGYICRLLASHLDAEMNLAMDGDHPFFRSIWETGFEVRVGCNPYMTPSDGAIDDGIPF